MSSTPVVSGFRVTGSLVLCVCFVDLCLSFCTFYFGHLWYVLLRVTDPDYPFGITPLVLHLWYYPFGVTPLVLPLWYYTFGITPLVLPLWYFQTLDN